MSKTYSAEELIELSREENRTVTEFPDTQEEYDALYDSLLVECDDSCDLSGNGHNEPESNGGCDFWGDDWRVEIIRPR